MSLLFKTVREDTPTSFSASQDGFKGCLNLF
jgi:hypothetical protein